MRLSFELRMGNYVSFIITGIEDLQIRRRVMRMYWLFVLGIIVLIAMNFVVSLLFFPETVETISLQTVIMLPFWVMILTGYTGWPFAIYRYCKPPVPFLTRVGLPAALGLLFGPLVFLLMLSANSTSPDFDVGKSELISVPMFFGLAGPFMMVFMSYFAHLSIGFVLRGRFQIYSKG